MADCSPKSLRFVNHRSRDSDLDPLAVFLKLPLVSGAGQLLGSIDERTFIIDEQLSQLIGRAYELNPLERIA